MKQPFMYFLQAFFLCIPLMAYAQFPLFYTNNALHFKESQYKELGEKIISLYKKDPLLEGKTLNINFFFQETSSNAFALKGRTNWEIRIFGGLIKSVFSHLDTFALSVCHELGHFFSKGPVFKEGNFAVEGAADFFSTAVCLPKAFEKDILSLNEIKNIEKNFPGAVHFCHQFSSPQRPLCLRLAQASILSALLSYLEEIKAGYFSSLLRFRIQNIHHPLPPYYPIPKNNPYLFGIKEKHSHATCRLETFFQGIKFYFESSQKVESSFYPLCWYNPQFLSKSLP